MKHILLLITVLCLSFAAKSQTESGYIIQVDGDKIYLDLHSPQVKVTDVVTVYADGGYMIHPVTKKKIKKEKEAVGHIEITAVNAEYSTGKALSALTVTPKEGMEIQKDAVVASTSQPTPVSAVSKPVIPEGKVAVWVTPAEVNDLAGIGYFGTYVADMLMEHLLLCDKITLVDRSILNSQLDEMNLKGKYIDPNTAIQQGKIIGARYVVQVTMQKPDVVNTKTGVPLASIMGAAQSISGTNIGAQYASNMGTATLKAAVSISTRVVDMQTGEVVFMCNGSGTAKGKTQLSMEYGALGGGMINGGAGGFKQTVTGQAIGKAFATIGNTLNDFFNGKTDSKVVNGANVKRTDALMYAKGASLYLGTEKLNEENLQMVFADTPNLYFDYKKGKRETKWSWVPMIVGGGATVFCGIPFIIQSNFDKTSPSLPGFGAGTFIGAAVFGGGLYLQLDGTKKIKNVAVEYNHPQNKSGANLGLVVNGNGVGLRLTF